MTVDARYSVHFSTQIPYALKLSTVRISFVDVACRLGVLHDSQL